MTDWDLMTPGIGLTSIGIVGVGISLSGIAKTFIDGMHAVSLLTMFIGMIFLASGLFKDGFPTSGRAKSATFITLGFLVTFGSAVAVTVSTQGTEHICIHWSYAYNFHPCNCASSCLLSWSSVPQALGSNIC